MDKISEERLKDLHPELQKRARVMLDALELQGVPCRVTEGLRPWSRQADLYAQGRTKLSTVGCAHGKPGTCAEHPLGATITKALPGHSWHQFGLAFDCVPDDLAIAGFQADWNLSHPVWQKVVAAGLAAGLESGSQWRTFKDWPHFQLASIPAAPTEQVRQTFQAAGIEEVWKELLA